MVCDCAFMQARFGIIGVGGVVVLFNVKDIATLVKYAAPVESFDAKGAARALDFILGDDPAN
eukprot:1024382-Lingulodinium_polyedra.AAC.1